MHMTESFHRRGFVVICLLAVWGAIATLMLLHYSVVDRDHYLRLGNRIARRKGIYYPDRARIVDRDGVPLAWTNRSFDLYVIFTSENFYLRERMIEELRGVIADAGLIRASDEMFLVKRNISPAEMLKTESLMKRYPAIKVIPRVERVVIDFPVVREYIGKTTSLDGRIIGLSGVEKEHDRALNGSPGTYQIMLDREKNWVPGSWQLLSQAIPGEDLILEVTLDQIKKSGETR